MSPEHSAWLIRPSSRSLVMGCLAAFILVGIIKVIQTYWVEYHAVGASTFWAVLNEPDTWVHGRSLVALSWCGCAVMLWRSASLPQPAPTHASASSHTPAPPDPSHTPHPAFPSRTPRPSASTSPHSRTHPLWTMTIASALGLLAGAASCGWTLLVTAHFDRSLNALIGFREAQTLSLAFITGPIDEEPLKLLAVLLILLILARQGFSPWLAALAGITVGEGFALVEDMTYLITSGLAHPYSTVEGAAQTFTLRNAFPGVGHWLCTGVAALGVASMLGSRPLPSFLASAYTTPQRRSRWGQLCIVAAIAGHALFNATLSVVPITLACVMPFILVALGRARRVLD